MHSPKYYEQLKFYHEPVDESIYQQRFKTVLEYMVKKTKPIFYDSVQSHYFSAG